MGSQPVAVSKNWYGIDLDKSFENRRFDGSLFNPVRKKLYLF